MGKERKAVENKHKGFFSRLVERIDAKLVQKSQEKKCCALPKEGGSSCCR